MESFPSKFWTVMTKTILVLGVYFVVLVSVVMWFVVAFLRWEHIGSCERGCRISYRICDPSDDWRNKHAIPGSRKSDLSEEPAQAGDRATEIPANPEN
jgi:hypothetical protein